MNFKRIQDKNTRLIISHFVDGASKSYSEYETIERNQKNIGKSYNSSLVITDKKTGNFIHTHSYN